MPACYLGHRVSLCILVAGLDDRTASAEIGIDTNPHG
jgi:hypothetical protein